MKLTLTVDEQHLKVSPKIFFRNHHCWHQDSHEQLKYVSLPPRFRRRSAALSPRPISGDWMELLLVGARRLPGDGRGGRQDEERRRRGNVNIAFWIKVDNGHQATALSFWCTHIFPSFLFWFRLTRFYENFPSLYVTKQEFRIFSVITPLNLC